MDINFYFTVFGIVYILIGILYALKEREAIEDLEKKSLTNRKQNEDLIQASLDTIHEYKNLCREYKGTEIEEAGSVESDKDIKNMYKLIAKHERKRKRKSLNTTSLRRFVDDKTILILIFMARIVFWLPSMCYKGIDKILSLKHAMEMARLKKVKNELMLEHQWLQIEKRKFAQIVAENNASIEKTVEEKG